MFCASYRHEGNITLFLPNSVIYLLSFMFSKLTWFILSSETLKKNVLVFIDFHSVEIQCKSMGTFGGCSLYPASATEGNVYGCVMTSMWVNHRFLIFGMNWNDDHVFFSAHSYSLTSSLEQKMFWRMSPIKPVPIGNVEIQWKSTAARNVCQRFSHQCCFRRKKCI